MVGAIKTNPFIARRKVILTPKIIDCFSQNGNKTASLKGKKPVKNKPPMMEGKTKILNPSLNGPTLSDSRLKGSRLLAPWNNFIAIRAEYPTVKRVAV